MALPFRSGSVLLASGLALYAVAVGEVQSRFAWLPPAGYAASGALLLLAAAALVRYQRTDRAAPAALLLAALAALGIGSALQRGVRGESTGANRAADRVDAWLADLSRQVGDAAYLIARTPAIAAAVEGSDARDTHGPAFAALSGWRLPDAGIGPATATLYDRGLEPVAWSGRNPHIDAALGEMFPEGVRAEDCPEPYFPLFFFSEEGGRGTLVAAECLRNRLGLVTVEAPISEDPPPVFGDPPLSALEIAGRRGMTVQFLRGAEDPSALASLFELRGERFREGSPDALEYFFALRAYDGQLLGVANTLIAPPRVREAERRARAQPLAAFALFAGGAVAGTLLWKSGLFGALAAVGLFLFGGGSLLRALSDAFPGAALFAWGGGASPGLPGIPASPAGALLTALAALAAMRVVQVQGPGGAAAPRKPLRAAAHGALAAGIVVALVLLLREIAATGAFPMTPRWQVGAGSAEIVGWFALMAAVSAAMLGALLALRRGGWASGAGWGAVALAGIGFGPAVGLAAAFAFAGALAVRRTSRGRLWMRQLRAPLGRKEPGLALFLALSLFIGPQLLLLPAMEWFEGASRHAFAATEAPAQIERHRYRVCHAAAEASAELARTAIAAAPPDAAWRLWLATGLPRLNLPSGLAVEGAEGAVSRFSVGFPRQAGAPMGPAAPDGAPGGAFRACAADSGDAFHVDGRLAGGERFRLTVAVRVADVPMASRPGGVADHFLLEDPAAPAIFAGRDLRLAPAAGLLDSDRASSSIPVGDELWRVSWRRTGWQDIAAGALGWLFLAVVFALVPAVAVRIRLLAPGSRRRRLRRSFRMQLTEALGAAVLVAVIGLSVFGERRMEAVLDGTSEAEAAERAGVAERVARASGAFEAGLDPSELELRLARAADQVDADLALYEAGRLAGVSRPALALAGLLPAHPAIPAMAAIGSEPVLDRAEPDSLRYRIAWVRLPGGVRERFLAVPLPRLEAAREAGARALQHTLVLAAGVVALVCAVLLPGFMARRLAAPVRRLARVTHRIADGSVEGPVAEAGDVDELRLLARSVERLTRRIPGVRRRMREEATADLARRAAHDIKNALAPIQFTADYIDRVARDPRGRDVRETALEGSRDILLQVERLRRISSEFSAVGAPLELEEVDLGTLTGETVAPYARASGGIGIRVEAELGLRVRADAGILARIVENLLQNALEAVGDSGREDGEIAVRARRAGSRARIEVEDNGPGVSRELRERVFEAEFSTRTRGSGLGLANTRRFAEAHGGSVRAESRPDGEPGLLIAVLLPLRGPGP